MSESGFLFQLFYIGCVPHKKTNGKDKRKKAKKKKKKHKTFKLQVILVNKLQTYVVKNQCGIHLLIFLLVILT